MASFSIQDLLGLSKESAVGRSNSGSCKSEAGFFKPSHALATKSKEATNRQLEDTAAGDDHEIDVETFDEDNAHHQLVTVEVRTVRHASSLSRSSSRKRKRAEQSESTPDSDDDSHHHSKRKSSSSPEYTAKDQDSRSSKRLRTAFTTVQLRTLEYFFRMCPYPDSYGREQIARATGIDEAKIQVWFQNRRARYRKREKPMEPQKSSAGRSPVTTSASSLSPHSMMQAFFTAAALTGSKLPTTPTTALPSPQPFFSPTAAGQSPFFTAGYTAMPPYPPYFTLPTSPMDLMVAAAAQKHAQHNKVAQQTAKHS